MRTAEKLIPCAFGFHPVRHGQADLWVQSLRTGRRIEIPAGWKHEIGPDVLPRLMVAFNAGAATVGFTSPELRSLMTLRAKLDQHFADTDQPRGPMIYPHGRTMSGF